MKLFVVVVSYKVTDLTLDCLRSLEKASHRTPDCKVAVVENGTSPSDAERLRRAIEAHGWGEWCELTALPVNLGFTGGNNAVIRPALASNDPPEYVLLLNADTIVPEGSLQVLLDFMEQRPHVGIAGTQLEFPDGEVQGTPFNFMNVASELDRGVQSKLFYKLMRPWATTINPKPSAASKVDWVAGASMMIRRAVFDRIGVLDDDYYTYYDDIDFCQSAAKAGFETWYVPEARIIHLEGKSTGIVNKTISPRADYWFEARRRYFLKHHGAAGAAVADAAFILGFAMRKARAKLTNAPLTEPPNMLEGAIKHSVFVTGFEMRAVQNPALAGKTKK